MSHELKTGGDRGYLRIATEEAFATREQVDVYLRMVKDGTADRGMVSLWGFYATSPSERATQIMERLLDLGDMRIAHMDATGIDKAILALTSPGVQPLTDLDEAKGIARRANDYLAERCAAHPDRFIGMTAVAPQDPEWSAAEIRRGAAELGFKGVQINSHTQGHYLDEPQFDPIFRALCDVGQPLYIHPATLPDAMMGGMIEAGLDGAIFGFGVETGLHALRMIVSGALDRFPKLQIIIGHMGEGLPAMLARIDDVGAPHVRHLKRKVSEMIVDQVWITSSGMFTQPPFLICLQTFGLDRMMFSIDYP